MDVLVAVLTGVFNRSIADRRDAWCGHRGSGQTVCAIVEGAWMSGIEVTSLAEKRELRDEQLVVV